MAAGDPAGPPGHAWLSVHQWRWDPGRLEEIIAEAEQVGAASLWLCGQASNALELAARLDAVFLLNIDQETIGRADATCGARQRLRPAR
ncbi:hypothetical protein [Dactylosporangium sp. CA-092794]|uniref:hypothetical protein n=1 Tax=Dactylosporangium sp. CA-092794 TaxID=3239929 RepID=UPI003D8CF043